jgi:flagellar export protein FliJ
LQRLVRLRKLVEDVHLRELDERRVALHQAESRLDGTRREIGFVDRLAARPTITAEELVLVNEYQVHLLRREITEKEGVVLRTTEFEAGREVLREAWQERRLMENLHERARTVEAEERDQVERRNLDALALDGFDRRRRGL